MNDKKLKLIFTIVVVWIVGELVTKTYYQEIKRICFDLLIKIVN
jgi:hypothetical protein